MQIVNQCLFLESVHSLILLMVICAFWQCLKTLLSNVLRSFFHSVHVQVFISLLWNLIVWICQKNKWKLKGSFLYWNKVFLLSTCSLDSSFSRLFDNLFIKFVHLIIIFHSSLIACTCTLESYGFQIHNFQDFKGS